MLARLEKKRAELLAYTPRTPVDPVALFRRAWGEPDAWQVRALTTPNDRILLNCARQSGKSTVSSTLAVSSILSRDNALVLLLSPSLRQSSELFQKCMQVYRSWPGVPEPRYETKLSLVLPNGPRLLSLPGRPDTIRGFSAVTDLIIDEAAFTGDPLYRAVRPMLAVSRGRLVLLSTPMGKRGYFHEEISERRERWHYEEVPVTLNPRIDPAFIEEERAALGPLFPQEYMCKFLSSETAMFDYEAVQRALDEGQEVWF